MMPETTHYQFRSLFRKGAFQLPPAEEPRLVLHASATNMHWLMICGAVVMLVALPQGVLHFWRSGGGREVLVFGAIAATILVSSIALLQHKSRWVIAQPSGLTVIRRTTIRKFPWREVRTILDLGFFGGVPPVAKRYHIEFANGEYFSFLGDTDAMARLQKMRPHWEKVEREARRRASSAVPADTAGNQGRD